MAGTKSGLSEKIEENLRTLVALRDRESEQRTSSQRRVERLSRALGRPMFLGTIFVFLIAWVSYNVVASGLGLPSVDRYPFPLLQGLVAVTALIATTVVLIAQNAQSKLERQHAHLALQITLLTEEKVTQLIRLLEELRRDLPMVVDRDDPQVEELREKADTNKVLTAIQEVGLMDVEADESPRDAGKEQPSQK